MVKKVLSIENKNAISDTEVKKRVTKRLKSEKITPKESVKMYFNTTEWKVYVIVDDEKKIVVDLEVE